MIDSSEGIPFIGPVSYFLSNEGRVVGDLGGSISSLKEQHPYGMSIADTFVV